MKINEIYLYDNQDECSLCGSSIIDSGGSLLTGLCLPHELQKASAGRMEIMFWKGMHSTVDVEHEHLTEARKIIEKQGGIDEVLF